MYYQLYNTKTGTVIMSYTTRGTASFGFARSLNPEISPSQITKGMKLYDYENMQHFSLTLEETVTLLYLLENQVTANLGTIVADVKKDKNGTEFYEIVTTHFPGSKEQKQQGMKSVSKLIVRLYQGLTGSVSLQKDEFFCSVPFTPQGFLTFLSFLKSHSTFVTILEALNVNDQLKQKNQSQQETEDKVEVATEGILPQKKLGNDIRPYSTPIEEETELPTPPPLEETKEEEVTTTVVKQEKEPKKKKFGLGV